MRLFKTEQKREARHLCDIKCDICNTKKEIRAIESKINGLNKALKNKLGHKPVKYSTNTKLRESQINALNKLTKQKGQLESRLEHLNKELEHRTEIIKIRLKKEFNLDESDIRNIILIISNIKRMHKHFEHEEDMKEECPELVPESKKEIKKEERELEEYLEYLKTLYNEKKKEEETVIKQFAFQPQIDPITEYQLWNIIKDYEYRIKKLEGKLEPSDKDKRILTTYKKRLKQLMNSLETYHEIEKDESLSIEERERYKLSKRTVFLAQHEIDLIERSENTIMKKVKTVVLGTLMGNIFAIGLAHFLISPEDIKAKALTLISLIAMDGLFIHKKNRYTEQLNKHDKNKEDYKLAQAENRDKLETVLNN